MQKSLSINEELIPAGQNVGICTYYNIMVYMKQFQVFGGSRSQETYYVPDWFIHKNSVTKI